MQAPIAMRLIPGPSRICSDPSRIALDSQLSDGRANGRPAAADESGGFGGPAGPGGLSAGSQAPPGDGATRAEPIVMEQRRASISLPSAIGRGRACSGMEVAHPTLKTLKPGSCPPSATAPPSKGMHAHSQPILEKHPPGNKKGMRLPYVMSRCAPLCSHGPAGRAGCGWRTGVNGGDFPPSHGAWSFTRPRGPPGCTFTPARHSDVRDHSRTGDRDSTPHRGYHFGRPLPILADHREWRSHH